MMRVLTSTPSGVSLAPEGGMPHVDEAAGSFDGNARLKAEALSCQVAGWVVADDSGLQVDALGGEPGVHSARYGEPDHPGLDDAGRREQRGVGASTVVSFGRRTNDV